jgi:hypothetical protein
MALRNRCLAYSSCIQETIRDMTNLSCKLFIKFRFSSSDVLHLISTINHCGSVQLYAVTAAPLNTVTVCSICV